MAAGRFFVYGTLMPGQLRWPSLAPYARSWRRATAPGRMWDTGRGFPAVRFQPAGDPIPGVAVDIVPELLDAAVEAVEDIEEVGVLYRRVDVVTSAGPAMAYEWLGPVDGMATMTGGWAPTPG